MKRFDTIVLGLGAMGSAALCQLARRGNGVLGIDHLVIDDSARVSDEPTGRIVNRDGDAILHHAP